MISSLEGFSWTGIKGRMTIRPTDHVLIQPMYLAKLTKSGTKYSPSLVKTIQSVQTPAS